MQKQNKELVISKLEALRNEFNECADGFARENPIIGFLNGHRCKSTGLRADAARIDKVLKEYRSPDEFEVMFSKVRLASQRASFDMVARVYEDIGKSAARFVLGKCDNEASQARAVRAKMDDILALM